MYGCTVEYSMLLKGLDFETLPRLVVFELVLVFEILHLFKKEGNS